MNQLTIAKLVSWLALALVVIPSMLSFLELLSLAHIQWCALAGTILWFVVTPMWMSREPEIDDAEVEI